MVGRRQIRVEGTVVEVRSARLDTFDGRTPIVLDVHTPEGQLVRVAFKQGLVGHFLVEPKAGDVVPVDWDPKRGTASLALKGDGRYDLKLRERQQNDALKAAANAPAGTPSLGEGGENGFSEDVQESLSTAGSAADTLARGDSVRVVILESLDMEAKSPAGVDMYAFTLSVIREGQESYEIEVGNPVPPDAVPLVFPGSNVPAKVLGDDPYPVIDWTAALAESTPRP